TFPYAIFPGNLSTVIRRSVRTSCMVDSKWLGIEYLHSPVRFSKHRRLRKAIHSFHCAMKSISNKLTYDFKTSFVMFPTSYSCLSSK
ncbi:hypothetical protein L9F63_012412, partial [Diploptera punctata]